VRYLLASRSRLAHVSLFKYVGAVAEMPEATDATDRHKGRRPGGGGRAKYCAFVSKMYVCVCVVMWVKSIDAGINCMWLCGK
jgi:hypothetical protein